MVVRVFESNQPSLIIVTSVAIIDHASAPLVDNGNIALPRVTKHAWETTKVELHV